MPSKESGELVDLYRSWVAAMAAKPDMDLEEIRRVFSHWGDVTVDPRGVDYQEIEVEGIPAMWAIPHGAVRDRALLCSHGGGYVVGSMYTHRKLFGHIAKAVGCRALIVDYRRRNLLLHLLHKALFALAGDRVAYLSRLTARRPGAIGAGGDVEALVATFADRPLDRV